MIERRSPRFSFLLLVGGLLFITSARADIIQTRDGRTIEGKILEKTATAYRVRVALGVIEIPLDQVRGEPIRGEQKQTEFEARWMKLAADDVAGRIAIAQWARSKGLKQESDRAYRDVLRLDPDHEGARLALGFQRFEGRWRKPAEIAKIKREREDAAARAEQLMKEKTGKIYYEGRWVSPEEKANLEKGLVPYQGQWVTPEAKANLEKGLVDAGGEWVTPEEKARRDKAAAAPARSAAPSPQAIQDVNEQLQKLYADATPYTSEHFLFRTNIDEGQAKAYLKDLEGAYTFAKKACGGIEPTEGLPFVVQMFRTLDQYKQAAASADEHSSAFGSFVLDQPVHLGVATFSDGTDRGRLHLFHAVGHLYGDAVFHPETPRWFREGFASHVERWFNDQAVAWSKSTMRKYPLQSMPDLLDSFAQVTDANVLQAGMIVTLFRNDTKYKDVWDTLISTATNKKGRKVERTFFKTLRKARGLDKDLARFVQQ